MNLKNKNVLVYGYGKSGQAAVELLTAVGARVYLCDDIAVNSPPRHTIIVSAEYINVDNYDLVIVSPSVPLDKPQLVKGRCLGKVISELELAYCFLDAELIAISGTNGKTTVTLLINEILNRAGYISYALGNIGIPLSEKARELTPSDIAVTEVSSFQLEGCREFSPDIAVLTNITSDHLDRHKTEKNYIAAKAKLFENQISGDVAVLNADDKNSVGLAKNIAADIYYFSTEKKVRGAYVDNGNIFYDDKGKIRICAVSDMTLKGKFNLENALAAITACVKRGIDPEIIKLVLKSFEPPEFRMQYLCEKRGKKFYNDSKGTNVSATLASCKALDGKTFLILGGRSKGENFEFLFRNLPKNVVHAFVTGENAPEIIESALKCDWYNVSHRATLTECVMESATAVCENVLFSPSSSSFDTYKNYRERGRIFSDLVNKL